MLTPHQAKYYAYELTKRCPSDSVEKFSATLLDAQVDLNPHQVEAALFAFKSPLSNGAILADEVGLGKTIEAGLVISQKWAERKRRILIITPANLRKQWSQELQDKFFLPSIILESKSYKQLDKESSRSPFDRPEIVICSFQFARSKEGDVRRIEWDLVIIDEAHRLRNVYKPANKIANSIKTSLEDRDKILLTATPLQNSLDELFGLVSIIDEHVFGDLKSFRSQYSRINGSTNEEIFLELKERIKPVCQRTLRRQVINIPYTNRIALVEEFYPTQDEQMLYDLVSGYLQRENLYALPASQRRLMTLILRRLLASSTFAISATLERLGQKLENSINEQAGSDIEEEVSEEFEAFNEFKEEWEEEPEPETPFSSQELELIRTEMLELKEFEALAKSIVKNSKGEKLIQCLGKAFEVATQPNEEGKRAAEKAIIFTESRRTQDYLRNILETNGYEGRVVIFNGTNNDPHSREIYNNWLGKHKNTDRVSGSRTADMRAALVDYFRNEAKIMIATEAAAEGINLQFCSLVINYDMPWNPQRIEQRIGRCHRYGQSFDVVVVNFLNKANAADVRVYELLRDKFKLFDGVFGASDEVLGAVENGIDFEKRIFQIYQECRTTDEIDAAFQQLNKEFEAPITEAMQKTRKQLLENFDEEVNEKLRINHEKSTKSLNRYENWLWNITRFYLEDKASFSENEFAFTLNKDPFPGLDIHEGPYRLGKNVEDVNLYRFNHKLAHRIMEECKKLAPSPAKLIFDYSGTPRKITILEQYVGKSGWLKAQLYTVSSLDEEDFVLLAGLDDDGLPLDFEHLSRMLSLEAAEKGSARYSQETLTKLDAQLEIKKKKIIGDVGNRNYRYFEQELEKLDKWGEDRRNSLRINLKELDEQIKEIKKQARFATNLPEKLSFEKKRRKLESDRDEAWREYDLAAKEIEKNKDSLIDEIEERLKQTEETEDLFFIQWEIK